MRTKTIAFLCALLAGTALLAQMSFTVTGPADAKPYEQTAVKELNDYLARRVGYNTLSIGGHSPVVFQVGDTALAREQGCLSKELEDERWVIRSVGDQVLLNGGGTRGALYAVYHFLEDYCDIHWWSDYEEYVPEASDLAIAALDATGKPVFLYRDVYRTFMGPDNEQTAIRVRLNRNGGERLTLLPMSLGGSFGYGNPGHCHTFDLYVNHAQYGKEHPEYFSLVNGKRVGGVYQGQLCLSNPELKALFLSQLLNYIENDRKTAQGWGTVPARIYDVSMNDNWNRCACAACQAEEEKYNPSGFYLNFVNWIAGEVAKKYPDIYISTLAYFYTEEPPKGGVRAADNVIVKLCDTRTNQAASILEEQNKVFADFLASWKGLAKNLFVWDYAIVYTDKITGYPFASELHYGDLYRTYRENNVNGIFWEHENAHMADFYELKFFLEAKLLEDPDQDTGKLIDLFMDRYYGKAGPHILAYRRFIDAERKKNNGYVSWFPKAEAFNYLTDNDLLTCHEFFEKAESAVASNPILLARVRRARTGLDRLTCRRSRDLLKTAPDKKAVVKAAYKRLAEDRPKWVRNWRGEADALKGFQAELDELVKLIPEGVLE